MTPEEYEQKTDRLHLRAYQAGMLYARLRQLKGRLPYPVPKFIIDADQTRLDRIADEVSLLSRELIDYDTEQEEAAGLR